MKKEIGLVIFLFFLIFVGTVFLVRSPEYDYLRLHIRANSNLSIDQNVKYEVKACVVEFLTPLFSTVKSKEDAVKLATKYKDQIKIKCDKVLKEKGCNTAVGDEGGYAPKLCSNEDALASVVKAIRSAGYVPGKDFKLALDIAASEFYDEKTKSVSLTESGVEKIYKINDFVGENNDHAVQELIDSWEAWLEETFGKNWDEI